MADIVQAPENNRLAAWANDKPAIIVNIQRQPGANVIETVDRIQAMLPRLQASLPGAVQLSMLSDRTVTIRAALRDVQFELVLAVAPSWARLPAWGAWRRYQELREWLPQSAPAIPGAAR